MTYLLASALPQEAAGLRLRKLLQRPGILRHARRL